MYRYVVNRVAQDNGDHEVHREGCRYWPQTFVELGRHLSCSGALTEARRYYVTANGCAFCARECRHTQ